MRPDEQLAQELELAAKRKRLYGRLHGLCKQGGVDDDAYRALLVRHGATVPAGRDAPSATTLEFRALLAVVDELARKVEGKPASSAVQTATEWRQARLALATRLWCALADQGGIRDRSEAALLKFVKRLSRKDRLQWVTGTDLNNAIEALKAMAVRDTGAELREELVVVDGRRRRQRWLWWPNQQVHLS